MITILLHCIANRMQRVYYARGCYNSDTYYDLTFFRFPRNVQQYDLVIIHFRARKELYFIVHK